MKYKRKFLEGYTTFQVQIYIILENLVSNSIFSPTHLFPNMFR